MEIFDNFIVQSSQAYCFQYRVDASASISMTIPSSQTIKIIIDKF